MRSPAGRVWLLALMLAGLARPAWAAGPEIRGRVTDGDGPVAAARVELSPLVGRWGLGDLLLQGKARPEPARRAVTRADGSFVVTAPSAGMWRLVVAAEGRVPAQVALIPAYRDLELPDVALRPDHGVDLRVVDALGRPLERAAVVAYARGEAGFEDGLPAPRWQRATEVAFTGEDGRVHLTCARGETLQVQVMEPAHPTASLEIALPAPGEMEVRLERGRKVALRAVNSAGEPVPGVLVWLGADPFPIGWTGDDGTTGLTLPRRAGLTLGLASEAGHSAVYTLSALTDLESVRVPLDDPVSRSGRVLRRGSQEPVPGAVVWSWYRPDRATHSDRDGWFALDGVDTKGRLTAARDGYLPGHTQVDTESGAGASAVLQLVATARVEGLVVDESGEPVAGVGVRPVRESEWLPAGAQVEWTQRTSADGTFILVDLPVEADLGFAVGGRDHQGVLWATQVRVQEPLAPGEVRTGVVLEVQQGVTVFGRIVDGSEQPVAGARVQLRGRSPRHRLLALRQADGLADTTDEAGAWRVEALVPDVYGLRVEADGFAPTEVPGLPIEPDGPRVQDLGTVVLVPGVDLEGRVVDEDGQPVAGAQVSLSEVDGAGDDGTVTADDGGFVLRDLRRGARVRLAASHPDFVHGLVGPLAVPAAEPVEVVLERSATVFGQVRDDGGWPVAGARVALFAQGGGGDGRGSTVETDEQGEFALFGISSGPATLQVTHRDFPMHSQPVDVLAPNLGATRADVRLRTAAGSVLGRILDELGEPVAAAMVLLPGDGIDRPASAHSDAQGSFHVRNVDPGPREVVVHHAAFASFRTELEVGADTWLDVELKRGHTVHGRVVDGDGLPVAGARILTTPLDAAARATRQGAESGADGTWTLDKLLTGRYLIRPRAEGLFARLPPEPLLVDRDLEGIVLEMGRGVRLEGQVLGIEFDDLPSVRVAAHRLWSEVEDMPMPSVAEVDYEGRFVFHGLSPGTWSVSAEYGSGRRVQKEVTIGDDVPEPLVLRFEKGVDLSGRVTLDRRAAGHLTLMLTSYDGDRSATRSASVQYDGRYQFEDVREGVYSLALLVPGGVLWRQRIELFESRIVDIEPPTTRVSGTVRDADGRPLGDVRLHLRRLDAEPADGADAGAGADGAAGAMLETRSSASTGDDGRFRIDLLPPGHYELMLYRQGFVQTRQLVELPEGVATDLDLVLEQAAALVFRARVGGVPQQLLAWALSDASGRFVAAGTSHVMEADAPFQIATLPAGEWVLWLQAPDSAASPHAVSVPGDAGTLDLPSGAALELRSSTGQRARYELQLVAADGTFARFLDDSGFGQGLADRRVAWSGSTVASLPPGSWQLVLRDADGTVVRRAVELVAGQVARVEVP